MIVDLPDKPWVENEGGLWTRQMFGRQYSIDTWPRWLPDWHPFFERGAGSNQVLGIVVLLVSMLLSLGQSPKVVVLRTIVVNDWPGTAGISSVVAHRRVVRGDDAAAVSAEFRALVDAGTYVPLPNEATRPIVRWWRRVRSAGSGR